jgi:hypothetical protein
MWEFKKAIFKPVLSLAELPPALAGGQKECLRIGFSQIFFLSVVSTDSKTEKSIFSVMRIR